MKISQINYIGDEIISILIYNRNGNYKSNQKITVKCSKCNNIKEIFYGSHRQNRLNSKNQYKCHTCTESEKMRIRNLSRAGKSWEDLYGIEKAKKLKKQSSIQRKLNPVKNFMYAALGKPSKLKGKTFEELYGTEKAAIKRKKCAHYGKDNAQFGKPSYQGSGNGWSGWYKTWYFRSIKELSFMVNYIEKNNYEWQSLESKKYAIPYINYDNTNRNYFADFLLNNKIVAEIKPKSLINTPKVQLKAKAAIEWCKQFNYEYKIFNDSDDFQLLSNQELLTLYNTNMIKWLPKYEQKFKEKYICS